MSSRLGKLEFVRSHGLGNDYLVVDGETLGVELTPARIRRLCDRHRGVGSDGILVLVPPPAGFDAAVRIYNPDGSEAEKSGNGVRIFAKFCLDHGYAPGKTLLRVHTAGGPVLAHLERRDEAHSVLRLSMGTISFRCADLPMISGGGGGGSGGGDAEWIEQPLDVGDRTLRTTCLSIGNPHTVVFDAPFDTEALVRYGPLIEGHARFPRRTNVQLVQVVDRSVVRALIWERGAGPTASSGSSACAVAAACVRANLVERDVRVEMPGGVLEVQVHPDWSVEQRGPAQELCVGRLSPELVAELA